MLFIPLMNIPAQMFSIILGEQNCDIAIYWRKGRFYCDLSVENMPLLQGAICENRARVNQSPTPYFKGSLHFFDIEGDTWPEVDFLEKRYVLIYLEDGEAVPDILRY